MSLLAAATQVHWDMQPWQGWEPAQSRLSLEAHLVPSRHHVPSGDAEQGSDTTMTLHHGPSLCPARSKTAHSP